MAPDPTTDKPPTARERAYRYVLDQILVGAFSGGTFIEEERVALAAAVSRTPVREAFHRLQSEGFLELVPRRGARVRQVTAVEMVELYEARRLVEGFAAKRICEARWGAPAQTKALAQEMRALGASDLRRHVELDRAYHRSLVAGARNAVLVDVLDGLRARQQHVAYAAIMTDPSRIETILTEHELMVDALERHDGPGVIELLNRHLRPVQHVVEALP